MIVDFLCGILSLACASGIASFLLCRVILEWKRLRMLEREAVDSTFVQWTDDCGRVHYRKPFILRLEDKRSENPIE